jgi:hypothetical protein
LPVAERAPDPPRDVVPRGLRVDLVLVAMNYTVLPGGVIAAEVVASVMHSRHHRARYASMTSGTIIGRLR